MALKGFKFLFSITSLIQSFEEKGITSLNSLFGEN
jgi:hypothetical protein